MTHKDHIHQIIKEFSQKAKRKYMKGVKEHGGNLWEKKHLIDFAIEEVLDQYIYLTTLRDQIKKSGVELGEKEE